MVALRCDGCGGEVSAPGKRAGETYECPGCGKTVVVPEEGAAPPGQSDDAVAPQDRPRKLRHVGATLAVVVALVVWRVISSAPGREADEHFNRGVACAEKGDYESAIGEYTKAIELRPDDVEAY